MAPGAPHQGPFRADTYASRSRTTPQLRAPPRHARPRATASLGGRCGSRPPTRRVPVAEPRPLRSTPSGGRAAPPLSSPFANPAAAQGAPTGSDAGRWSRPTPAVTRPDAVTLGGATVAAVALMSVDERVAPWGQSRTVQGARAPARHRGVPRPRRPRRARGGQRDLRDRARPPRPRRRRRRAARHRRDRRGGGRHGRDRGGRGACPPVRHGRLQRAQLRVRAWPAPRQRLPAFPSGHATAAVAFAAALSGEGRHRRARANRVGGPGGAAAPRVSAARRWRGPRARPPPARGPRPAPAGRPPRRAASRRRPRTESRPARSPRCRRSRSPATARAA